MTFDPESALIDLHPHKSQAAQGLLSPLDLYDLDLNLYDLDLCHVSSFTE